MKFYELEFLELHDIADARLTEDLTKRWSQPAVSSMHLYEVRPRKDHRGVDLTSDVLPLGWLRYDTPDHAIGYAMHSNRSHDAVIRVYDADGNVIGTHEHAGIQKAIARSFHAAWRATSVYRCHAFPSHLR